jgi:hypothetical protein
MYLRTSDAFSRVHLVGCLVIGFLFADACGCRESPPARSQADVAAVQGVNNQGGAVFRGRHKWDKNVTLGPEWKGGNSGLVHLCGLDFVGELAVEYSEFDDGALDRVVSLPRLTGLRLRNTRVSADGLRTLRRARDLVMLQVEGEKVSDDTLAAIQELELKWLVLGPESAVTDAGVQHLTGMTGLVSLHLPGSRVTGRGLAKLAQLDNLRELVLSGGPLDDDDLRQLPFFSRLNRVDFSGTRITGPGLSHLSRFPRLREVVLDDTPLSDEGARALSDLRALDALSLNRTRITEAALPALAELDMLHVLSLEGTSVRGEALRVLQHIPGLTTVTIGNGDVVVFRKDWMTQGPWGGLVLRGVLDDQGRKAFLWTDNGPKPIEVSAEKGATHTSNPYNP